MCLILFQKSVLLFVGNNRSIFKALDFACLQSVNNFFYFFFLET